MAHVFPERRGIKTHSQLECALDCGLLRGFKPSQVQPVGNTSLAGAYLALVDRNLLKECIQVARRLDFIELNTDPSFESRFIDELTFAT
jgi:uncharacterized 2Fe-2S/4Fe-4S cluster protein (DUF4445 family)